MNQHLQSSPLFQPTAFKEVTRWGEVGAGTCAHALVIYSLVFTNMGCWTAAFGAALCLRWWQLSRKVQHQLAVDKTSGIIPAGATPAGSVVALGLPTHKTNQESCKSLASDGHGPVRTSHFG